MSMSWRLCLATSAGVALALMSGCSPKKAEEPAAAAPAAAAASGILPDASIIDLMKDSIAPAAEALWNAVGTESTTTGTKDFAPSTDAEWAAVRQKAQTIVDTARALVDEGRVVGHPGQKLKDPPGPGDLTPEQAQAEIAKDRAAFGAFATAMQSVGTEFLAVIDKKNVESFTEVGGKLDEVCEACHKRYWYPNSGAPPVQ